MNGNEIQLFHSGKPRAHRDLQRPSLARRQRAQQAGGRACRIVDRTRQRQVRTLLEHPQMNSGPSILVGDMNAWRNCTGSKELEENLDTHPNINWPSSFPSGRSQLALDQIYTRRAEGIEVRHHDSPAARKASDRLPIVAEVVIEKVGSEASR